MHPSTATAQALCAQARRELSSACATVTGSFLHFLAVRAAESTVAFVRLIVSGGVSTGLTVSAMDAVVAGVIEARCDGSGRGHTKCGCKGTACVNPGCETSAGDGQPFKHPHDTDSVVSWIEESCDEKAIRERYMYPIGLNATTLGCRCTC